MKFTNYAIKGSKGVFYTTSKEPQEGYTENKYTDRETKKEKTNYHKEVETLTGKLHSIKLKQSELVGERLAISLTDAKGDANVLEIPVFRNTNGDVDEYTKSCIQYLSNLVLNAETEIFCNSKNKDKKGYLYKNVFFKQDGEQIPWEFKIFGEDSPVPKAVQKEHKVTKQIKWNFEDQNVWFYDKLTSSVKNICAMQESTSQNSNSSAPDTAVPESNNADVDAPNADGVDDLPF